MNIKTVSAFLTSAIMAVGVTFSAYADGTYYLIGGDSSSSDCSFSGSTAGATKGWNTDPNATAALTHTVSSDYDYVVRGTGSDSYYYLRTHTPLDDETFAGKSLTLDALGTLFLKTKNSADTAKRVTVPRLIVGNNAIVGIGNTGAGFVLDGGIVFTNDSRLVIFNGLDSSKAEDIRQLDIASTVTGAGVLAVGALDGNVGNPGTHTLTLSGDFSGFAGTIASLSANRLSGTFRLAVKGAYGGTVTSLPILNTAKDNLIAFDYDELVDGATKGLSIATATPDETILSQVTFVLSESKYVGAELALMTFPAELNKTASDFTVRYAGTFGGATLEFVSLRLRSNSDNTVTLMGALSESSQLPKYWRWTSNAQDAEPTWTEVAEATLSVPAFTGATAEDNVLELLDDCSVSSILYFTKNCTICTSTNLDSVATVTFTANHYCVCQADEIKTRDVVFTGAANWNQPSNAINASNSATAGNCAWAIYKSGGGAKLTLGSGTVIRDFYVSKSLTGIGSFRGAIILPCENGDYHKLNSKTPVLEICDGAQIVNVRGFASAVTIANGLGNAVIRMTGGEITGCYNCLYRSDRRGTVHLNSGKFYLSGGSIHDNYANNSLDRSLIPASGVYAHDGYVYLSGSPVVSNNFTQSVANGDYYPLNLSANTNNRIYLSGDLVDGAYVGCSQNVGDGNVFGAADGRYKGAWYIHADSDSKLAGRCSDGNLVWKYIKRPSAVILR